MKIKMLVSITGTIDGVSWPDRGGEIDVHESIASDLIANGYATISPKMETASVDPVAETATKPTAKPRKV